VSSTPNLASTDVAPLLWPVNGMEAASITPSRRADAKTHSPGGSPQKPGDGGGQDASDDPIRVLAISGSLRAHSSNTEVLRAASLLAPRGVHVALFTALGAVPLFNPDMDAEGMAPPPAVAGFRRLVAEADALLISTPEYAHGVPGALKNALDWLVSFPDVLFKPVAVLNSAPRSWHAFASLTETLDTMSMTVVASASTSVPVSDRTLTAEGLRQDPDFVIALRGALGSLTSAALDYRRHRREPREESSR
jgi:chromate reductase